MEKYGFVYIWFDKKHKMFYVGSHWGFVDDGYICSSRRMRKAYKRRPQDFKRRILSKVHNKQELLDTEYKWLSLLESEELGKKYYNLTNHQNGHWFTEEHRLKTLKQKISERTKEAMYRPDVREKYLKGLKTRNNTQTQEAIEKRRNSMKDTMATKYPVENRKQYVKFGSEEYRNNMAESVAESWKHRDKEAIGNKISDSLKASKELRSKTISSYFWWNNGEKNTRKATCPGEGWVKGKLR